MKNIVVCNQKGGVGKSLVADELAFSLERSKLSTSFYDLDGQGGTLHETKEVESAETSVVDTPGALQRELADWLKGTDFTCVVRIPQSELFVQAGAAGISVVDFAPRSKAARAVLEMCYAVRHVAGLPQE